MNKDISEADCWFVIGAYQAGATERDCSQLSGLTKTITHNIISNFKKLGSPHATKLSMNELLNKSGSSNGTKKRTRNKDDNDGQPKKRGRPRKPVEEPFFTQSLLKKVLFEASRTDQKETVILPTTTTIDNDYNEEVESNNKESIRMLSPHDRLDTPPSDDDMIKVLRRGSEESAYLFLPPTPRSPLESLDEEEEQQQQWSLEDDQVLISHILNLPCKNIKWKELEQNMNDRHLAKICSERWDFLKKQLLKDVHSVIDKPQNTLSPLKQNKIK